MHQRDYHFRTHSTLEVEAASEVGYLLAFPMNGLKRLK